MAVVYVGNSSLMTLSGLRDELDGAFINDATVEVTVLDHLEQPVAGQTWPTSMTYVASSDGNYRAILKDMVQLVANARYVAHIVANGGTDRVGDWRFPFRPTIRTGV